MTTLGGAFVSGDDADGLRSLRKKFGRTEFDDRLFALGYPHIVMLDDNPFDPKTAKKCETHHPGTAGSFSRGLALRVANAGYKGVDEVIAASEKELTVAGLKKAVETAVAFEADRLLYLEAVTSSEQVAQLAVAYISKLPVAAWKQHPFETEGGDSLRVLYFILLRCTTPVRAALRKTLETTFGKVARTMKDGFWRPLQGLDLCLHGVAGVKRSGYRPDDTDLAFGDLVFADDDPAFVAAEVKHKLPTIKPNDSPVFDARLAFLGGAATTKLLCGAMSHYNSQHHAAMVAQLGRVSGVPVVAFMKAAVDRPKTRVAATAWLAANT